MNPSEKPDPDDPLGTGAFSLPDDPSRTTDLPAVGGKETDRPAGTSVGPADPGTVAYWPDPGTIDHSPDGTIDHAPNGTVDLPASAFAPASTVDLNRTGAHTPTFEPTAPRRPPASPPGYEILGELGRGGMGVVYKARQTGLGRVVALKMILAGPHAGAAAVGRFLAEAQAVARFQHPGIVQVFEIGEHAGLPFFTLEFVPGGTLARKTHKEPQPQRYAAETAEKLARAMQYAHDRGIVHRDLKPDNVLLTADGEPKVTDFGLAKALDVDSGQTRSGTIMGTPSYMAPEQAEGRSDIGPAADVYALGAVLYDLLTGRPPFAGSSVLDTLEMVRTREPVAPSQLAGQLPRDLETICLKCLQKDPARRYASAALLADDLQAFLDGRPIAARPVGRAEKAWRWAKRNPWVAGPSALAAGLLLTVAVGGSVLSWQLYLAKGEAEQNAAQARSEALAKETARAAEEEQRKEAVKANGKAGVRLNQALASIRGVLLTVDDVMRNRADLAPLRRRILDAMLKDLDTIKDSELRDPFAAVQGRFTPEQLLRRNEGVAYARIGEVYAKANRMQDADAWLQKAHAIYITERAINPDDPITARNLAAIANQLSDIKLQLGDLAAARELRGAALDLRREREKTLAARGDGPDLTPAREDVATSLRLVADADLQLGDPAAAAAGYAAADRAFAALPAKRAATLTVRTERVLVRKRISEAQFALGDRAGAETAARAVVAEREAMARQYAKDPALSASTRVDVGVARMALGGILHTGPNGIPAAVAEYTQAHALFTAAAKEQPDHLGYRRAVGDVLYRLGDTASDPKQAAAHFADCLKIRAALAAIDPTDTQARVEWMLALGRCGKTAEAEKLADELKAKYGTDRRVLFHAACGFSVAAGGASDAAVAARCRAKAVQTVTDLIARGWKDRVALETDPDLTPIRSEQAFRDAVSKLPTPSAPK